MNRCFGIGLCCMVFMLFSGCASQEKSFLNPFGSSSSVSWEEYDKITAQIESLQEEQKHVAGVMEVMQTNHKRLSENLSTLDRERAALEQQISAARMSLEGLENRLQDKKAEIDQVSQSTGISRDSYESRFVENEELKEKIEALMNQRINLREKLTERGIKREATTAP